MTVAKNEEKNCMSSWSFNFDFNFLFSGHDWRFAKIKINHICVLDTFGGRKFPTVAEYFKADPDYLTLNSFIKVH